MKWTDIDPGMKQCCYAREVLRRFGFAPEDLFFAYHPTGHVLENGVVHHIDKPTLFVRVEAQGKTFMWTVATTELSAEQARDHYEQACKIWNAGEADADRHGFFMSVPFMMRYAVADAITRKGFTLPEGPK